MSDNLVLELARRRVVAFADAAQQEAHGADRLRCEDLLRKGLDAHLWLARAEEFLRQAESDGLYCFTRETRETLHGLHRAWLAPCEAVARRVTGLLDLGCCPENLRQFWRACESSHEILERRADSPFAWRRNGLDEGPRPVSGKSSPEIAVLAEACPGR